MGGVSPCVFVITIYIIIYDIIIASGYDNLSWLTYFFPPFRMMEFIIGGFLCNCVVAINDEDEDRKTGLLFKLLFFYVILIVIDLLLCYLTGNRDFLRILQMYIPTWILLTLNGCSGVISSIFRSRILVFIGNISFELFLLHFMILRGMGNLLTYIEVYIPTFIYAVICFGVMIIVAFFINKINKLWRIELYKFMHL